MFWLSFPKRGSDVGWAPCPCKSQYQLLQPRLWKGPVVLQPRAPAAPPSHVGPLPRVTPARVWNPAPSSVSTKPLSPMGAVECMEWGRAGVGQGLHGPRTQSFPFPLEAPGLPPCPRKGLLSPHACGIPFSPSRRASPDCGPRPLSCPPPSPGTQKHRPVQVPSPYSPFLQSSQTKEEFWGTA